MTPNVDAVDAKLVELAAKYFKREDALDVLGREEDRETGDRKSAVTVRLKAAHAQRSAILARMASLRPVGPAGYAAMARVCRSADIEAGGCDDILPVVASLLASLAEADADL